PGHQSGRGGGRGAEIAGAQFATARGGRGMRDVLGSPAKAGAQISAETGPRPSPGHAEVRGDWTRAEIAALFDLPFTDLLWQAQQAHRRHHAPNEVQLSTLLSIKTGGCPEDCGYCSQSVHADTGLRAEKLMDVDA